MQLRRFFREGRHIIPLLAIMMIICASIYVAELIGPRHLITVGTWPPHVGIKRVN